MCCLVIPVVWVMAIVVLFIFVVLIPRLKARKESAQREKRRQLRDRQFEVNQAAKRRF